MSHKIDEEISEVADRLEKAGERGAVISGYTPSGQPKYQSNLQAQEQWRERHKKTPQPGAIVEKNEDEDGEKLSKPPVSEAQRRLMGAAAEGKVSDVPASVGKEFIDADQGGKLPAKKKMKKAEEELTMKDTIKGIMEKARVLGADGLKKASANLSDEQKVLLGKILTKAANKPEKIANKVDLEPRDQRDLQNRTIPKPESGYDTLDEKIMDPKEDEIKHQGDSTEGHEGQKIEDPKKEDEPKDEKPADSNPGDESNKMNAKEKEHSKRTSSIKKSEDEEFLKSVVKKAVKKALKKMSKKPKVEGAQKEYEKDAKDPKEFYEKPAKASKEESKEEPKEKEVKKPALKKGEEPMKHIEELKKSDEKMSALCSYMIKKGIKKETFLEKSASKIEDVARSSRIWDEVASKEKPQTMKKSIVWNDLQTDLFGSTYKRGRNHNFTSCNDEVEAQEKKQTENMKKGEYKNEFSPFDVLKKAEGTKKITIDQILEKGLDMNECTVEHINQRVDFAKSKKPDLKKSFDDSEMNKILGIDEAKANEILNKK